MPNYTISSNLSFDISYSVNAENTQVAESLFFENLNNAIYQLNALLQNHNIEADTDGCHLSDIEIDEELNNSRYTSMASLLTRQNTSPAPVEESNSSYTRLVRR